MKKYELTDETKMVCGRILHRIKALVDFGSVKAGDLGGWVEKEENLSHEGDCWVYNEAQVYDNACVYGNAHVYDDACVCGNARICNNACVYGNARAYDSARVYGNAEVFGNAHVFDYAQVHDNAHVSDDVRISDSACIYDNAEVYGNAEVFGNAYVFGNARISNSACVCDDACICNNACVYDNALVFGSARVSDSARIYDNAWVFDCACVCDDACVCGSARICENMQVSYSYAKTDLRRDIAASLRCQCNLLLTNNKVIAYKIVNKNLSSLYDKNFIYEIGKIAEVEDAEESHISCASGLHFSNLTYWDFKVRDYADKTYLVAEINVEDIITIQQGKIRCRKAKILEKVDIE